MAKFGRKRHIQLASNVANGNSEENEPRRKRSKIQKDKNQKESRESVLPLLEQISNKEDPELRLQALYTISSAIPDATPSDLRLYLSKNLIGILIDRVSAEDEAIVARTEAVCALRNVAASSPTNDVCREMFNKNIISRLMQLLEITHEAVYKEPEHDQMQTDTFANTLTLVPDLVENILSLLLSVANASTKALNSLASSNTLTVYLAHFITVQTYGISNSMTFRTHLSNLAGHLLYTLLSSESFSPPADCVPDLEDLIDRPVEDNAYDKVLLRMLAIVLTHAMSELPAKSHRYIRQVIENTNCEEIATKCQNLPNPKSLSASEQRKAEAELSRIEQRLVTLQYTLELLSEVALDAAFDRFPGTLMKEELEGDEEMVDDKENGDDDAGMMMDDADQLWDNERKAKVNGDAAKNGEQENESELFGRVSRLIEMCRPTSLAFREALPESDANKIPASGERGPIASHLGRVGILLTGISVMALECVHNLTLQNEQIKVNVPELWKNILETMSEIGFSDEERKNEDGGMMMAVEENSSQIEKDNEQLDRALLAGIGILWTILRVRSDELEVNGPQVTEFIVKVSGKVKDEDVKERCIGVLSCLGNRPGVGLDENEAIAKLFLSIQGTENDKLSPLEIQALDGLIDLYSDETKPQDEVFKKLGILEILQERAKGMKARVNKVDKRKEPDARRRAEGICTNLQAFVAYRKKLLA